MIRIKQLELRIKLLGLLFPLLFVLSLILHSKFLILPVRAQGIEVTNVYDVADEEAEDGDILISTDQGLVRANRGYSSRIFGVVQLQPIIAYKRVDQTGTPIARTSTALVNVSTLNGPIKIGDYVTSSEIPGKGQRAGLSGYALGVALENFEGEDGEKVTAVVNEVQKEATLGKIKVAIRIEYAELTGSRSLNRSFDYLNNALFRNVQDPEQFTQIIRYLMAGLAVVISFAVAFFTFMRAIPKAMEAIGRNPLAANTIRLSIILNIAFTIAVGLVGIIAAVIIIKL